MKIPAKLAPWFDARHRFKLTHAEIQMARELGMNPKKLGSLANARQEPWKAPLREFIAACYLKHFGRHEPAQVRSLEAIITNDLERRAQKRAAKEQAGNSSRRAM